MVACSDDGRADLDTDGEKAIADGRANRAATRAEREKSIIRIKVNQLDDPLSREHNEMQSDSSSLLTAKV